MCLTEITEQQRKNIIVVLSQGGIHKLHLQNLSFFDHLRTPLRLHFLWYKSLQKVYTYPPPLVNVVCEHPLRSFFYLIPTQKFDLPDYKLESMFKL